MAESKMAWVRTAQEVRDQRSGVDGRAEKASQGIAFPIPEMEIEARRRIGPPKEFTEEDVRAANPGDEFSPEEMASILEELNRKPDPEAIERFYEADNESLVQNIFTSLDHRGLDGLTEEERMANAFHEAFGAPPPFPPTPTDKK
jgi:hypothetical protein